MRKLSTRYVWGINGAKCYIISFWNYVFEDEMRESDKENEEILLCTAIVNYNFTWQKYMNHVFHTNINEKLKIINMN